MRRLVDGRRNIVMVSYLQNVDTERTIAVKFSIQNRPNHRVPLSSLLVLCYNEVNR